MLLSSLSPDQLSDLALPDAALAALAARTEWEYTPAVDAGNEHADWCDDCNGWHRSWSVFGLRLDADGTLWSTQHAVDTDGDWNLVDETPYTLDDTAFAEDAQDAEASWADYAGWVARTGDDPLGNYWISRPKDRVTRWRVTFAEEGGAVVVREARRGARTFLPAQLPAPVRAYLCLAEGAATVEGFASLDALRGQASGVRWIRGKDGVGEIQVRIPAQLDARTVRNRTRAAAKRHLEQAKRRA